MAAAAAVTAGWRLRPAVLAGLAVPALLAGAWVAGFAWFVHGVWAPPPPPPHADGIVALTGGADRVETALHLLAQGRADVLLVSGVGGPTEFSALARRAGIDPALGSRVTLGRAAASTHGNAVETADWVRANNIRSLLVVTAGYHMPRALSELARALPEVELHPVPVLPPGLRGAVPLRLLAGEYTKYLAAAAGLSRLAALVGPAGHADGRGPPRADAAADPEAGG